MKQKHLIIALLAAAVAVLLFSRPAAAVTLNDEVEVAWVCKSQAAVEAQIDTIIATKTTDGANALLKEGITKGECIQSPVGPVAMTVTKLGKAREPFEYKGVRINVIAVQVDDKFWTGSVEVLPPERKT